MSLLIYSGLLYLFGISIILTLKPELMFSKEGIWKEFGLGRANRTWMPFWLFAIAWAILSYLIVLVIMGSTNAPANSAISVSSTPMELENVSTKAMAPLTKKPASAEDMKMGYYILDANETIKKGVPKYIYLGPEAPNLVYHSMQRED